MSLLYVKLYVHCSYIYTMHLWTESNCSYMCMCIHGSQVADHLPGTSYHTYDNPTKSHDQHKRRSINANNYVYTCINSNNTFYAICVHMHMYFCRDLFKAFVIILPLLGFTWIIGLFAVNEDTAVFAWLFICVNSLQVFNYVLWLPAVPAGHKKVSKYTCRPSMIPSCITSLSSVFVSHYM